jgi:biotin carboxyl carrier protein
MSMDVRLSLNGAIYHARREGGGDVTLSGEDREPRTLQVLPAPGGGFTVGTDGETRAAEAVRDGSTVWVRFEGRTYRFERVGGRTRERTDTGGDLSSPMPGQVQKVLVSVGDAVEVHQPIMVVEAMKMQLEIKAPHAGTVKRILAEQGAQIEAGAPLAELEETSA